MASLGRTQMLKEQRMKRQKVKIPQNQRWKMSTWRVTQRMARRKATATQTVRKKPAAKHVLLWYVCVWRGFEGVLRAELREWELVPVL